MQNYIAFIRTLLENYENNLRGTGRTTDRIRQLRDGDTFVVCENRSYYTDLLRRFGVRANIVGVKNIQDLHEKLYRWEPGTVVFDHTVELMLLVEYLGNMEQEWKLIVKKACRPYPQPDSRSVWSQCFEQRWNPVEFDRPYTGRVHIENKIYPWDEKKEEEARKFLRPPGFPSVKDR